MRATTLFFASLFLALAAGGCAPVVVGGAMAGGAAANDARTVGAIVEDELIEDKALLAFNREFGINAQISAVSFNLRVLLVGQAPNEKIRARAEEIVRKLEHVKKVHNQIEVGGGASISARAADAVLTAKVKAALCRVQDTEGFSCLRVKVVSEGGVVYLMGIVPRAMAARAVMAARNVEGVRKVFRVFEYRENA